VQRGLKDQSNLPADNKIMQLVAEICIVNVSLNGGGRRDMQVVAEIGIIEDVQIKRLQKTR